MTMWLPSQWWHELPWCTRSPNLMPDVEAFVRRWRTGSEVVETVLHTTSAGSINGDGIEGSFTAKSLTPHDPQFWASLEPGIAPLVRKAVGLGALTYTSCQGHQLGADTYPAHLGLLCSDSELEDTAMLVNETKLAPTSRHLRHILTDETSGFKYATLEVYFDSNSSRRPPGPDW